MMYAANGGHDYSERECLKVVQFLVNEKGVDVNAKDKVRHTPESNIVPTFTVLRPFRLKSDPDGHRIGDADTVLQGPEAGAHVVAHPHWGSVAAKEPPA